MKAVSHTAVELGLPKENERLEPFQANSTGDRFTAESVESQKELEVAADTSLLDTLRRAGFEIPSTCEAGNCGTCRVRVRSGRGEHRSAGLLENERVVQF